MAIAFDAATDANLGNVTSGSFSHTVGAGSNLKLLVFVMARGDDGEIMNPVVTYNSVSMTMVGTGQTSDAVGNMTTYAFELNAPATGSHTVAYSGDVAPGSVILIAALSFTGVDQGSAYDAEGGYGALSVTDVTAGTDVTTTVADAWVVDGIGIRNNATITVDASQTERTNEVNAGVTVFATSTKGPVASPGAVSMDWTWTTANRVAQKIVAIAPAAVVTGVGPLLDSGRNRLVRAA